MERRGTNCEKWDFLEEEFGKKDLLALWVADMDFPAPPEVLSALHKKIDEGALGYPIAPDSLLRAITDWQSSRHGWKIGKESVTWAPGVVAGLAFSIMAYTKPGDGVIIQTPVYPPFYATVSESGRRVVKNPLRRQGGRYVMDLEGLEKLVCPTCRVLIMCSPHNPVARVWSRGELEALAELAVRKDMLIISDEIHQDLVYSDAKHISIASLSEEMASRTVTFVAPSKTFNIAGMNSSVALIPDEKLRARYISVMNRLHLGSLSILGLTAMETAYSKCAGWLDELMIYLEGNRDFTEKFLRERLQKAKMDHPEGTYVFWIDFRGYGFDSGTLMEFLVNEAKVALNNGLNFGVEGNGFARINIGTNRTLLKEALENIAKALELRS